MIRVGKGLNGSVGSFRIKLNKPRGITKNKVLGGGWNGIKIIDIGGKQKFEDI